MEASASHPIWVPSTIPSGVWTGRPSPLFRMLILPGDLVNAGDHGFGAPPASSREEQQALMRIEPGVDRHRASSWGARKEYRITPNEVLPQTSTRLTERSSSYRLCTQRRSGGLPGCREAPETPPLLRTWDVGRREVGSPSPCRLNREGHSRLLAERKATRRVTAAPCTSAFGPRLWEASATSRMPLR